MVSLEGDEYSLKNITLGGSTPGTSDFGGVGLQIRTIGKGILVMSKVNPDFGGSDVSSMVLEKGVVKKGAGATCGEMYSRIQVRDGAQFDLNLWKAKPASTVKFRRTESMARRGIHIVPDDDGIRFQTGVTIIIR